ncbi:MAG: hypothetical protein ACLSAP_12435 [Oscillospiraceae bacterium]
MQTFGYDCDAALAYAEQWALKRNRRYLDFENWEGLHQFCLAMPLCRLRRDESQTGFRLVLQPRVDSKLTPPERRAISV